MRNIICATEQNAIDLIASINTVMRANGYSSDYVWDIPRQVETAWHVQDPREVVESFVLEGLLNTVIVAATTSGLTTPYMSGLRVDGALIKDAANNNKQLRGVSVDIADTSFSGRSALQRCQDILEGANAFENITCIRIPAQPSRVDGGAALTHLSRWFDPAIQYCESRGVYVIVDYHAITPMTDADIDADLRGFWRVTATKYAKKKNIIFEMFNEPSNGGIGQSTWDAWQLLAQPWADHIRQYANNINIIGSPEFSQNGHLAQNNPVLGENIMYTQHFYPTHMPGGQPDSSATDEQKQTWLASKLSETTVPIFMTEYGYSDREQDEPSSYTDFSQGGAIWYTPDTRFIAPMNTFLAANPTVHYTAWSWSRTSGPAMIETDEPFVLTNFGTAVKNHFAGLAV